MTAAASPTMYRISARDSVPEAVSCMYGVGTSRSNFSALKPRSATTCRARSAYSSGVKTSSGIPFA